VEDGQNPPLKRFIEASIYTRFTKLARQLYKQVFISKQLLQVPM